MKKTLQSRVTPGLSVLSYQLDTINMNEPPKNLADRMRKVTSENKDASTDTGMLSFIAFDSLEELL